MSRPTCKDLATVRSDGSFSYVCGRPAKREANRSPFATISTWVPVCGIHARQYDEENLRPLPVEAPR